MKRLSFLALTSVMVLAIAAVLALAAGTGASDRAGGAVAASTPVALDPTSSRVAAQVVPDPAPAPTTAGGQPQAGPEPRFECRVLDGSEVCDTFGERDEGPGTTPSEGSQAGSEPRFECRVLDGSEVCDTFGERDEGPGTR